MIDERSKISMKLLAQESETSNKNKISRPICKSGSNCNKTKMEVSTNKISSARSLPPDPVRKNVGNNDEHQSKLKRTNVVPRNPSKDTSDGVQEFIKHVSQYIEKKTPFKGTTKCSFTDGGNSESPKFDSIQFNGMARKFNDRKKLEGLRLDKSHLNVDDKNKKTLMKRKNHPVKLNSVCPVKKDPIGAIGKGNSSTKKTEEVNKKLKRDQPEKKKNQSQPVKKVTADSSLHSENEGCFQKKTPPSRGKASNGSVQNKIKRRRPSEIPLRKDRRDSYKKPKFVSLLVQKPLKQVESAISVGFESTSKSFLPMEEMCSEVQMTISVNFSSGKIDYEGEKVDISGLDNEEMQESIRLDRCCKSPNIPDVVNASTNYLLKEKPSASKKAKVIDLDKVKTSSFTVLRTSSTVLDRLESLHKQNVLSKEKSVSKSKILMAKTSSKTFKENPKKIPHLMSSKGNKSGLKIKVKKSRKEITQERGTLRKLKKRPKSNNETSRVEETSKTGNIGRIPRNEKSPKESRLVTNENSKANVKNQKKEESKMRKIKSSREKSALKATPRDEEFKSSEPVISGIEYFENQIPEKSKSVTNFNSSIFQRNLSDRCLNISKSSEKIKLHDLAESIKNQETPSTPPPTPETECTNSFTEVGQIVCKDWSTKTVIFEHKFTGEEYGWCNVLQEAETVVPEIVTEKANEDEEMTEKSGSFGKGKLLNFCKGEPSEIPEKTEPPPVKKQLRIDLNTHEVYTDDERVEENEENQPTVDPPPMKAECTEGSNHNKDIPNATEKVGSEEGKRKSKTVSGDALSSEVVEESGSFSPTIQKPRKSCTSLKSKKQQCKSGSSIKGMRKKKIRSDAGDRPSPSGSTLFNSDPALQSKTKTDSKARSGLRKSAKWEEKTDVFEDAAAIKLKRRNSEPNSFRGYVWKCADSATPRGHKTSVSSMTSSLRHLNNDEIDDFIFWEAVPQKMTSCWEMSLYHFKRPWSVLSCSVFRDNRLSSTPGLILENLRNGGALNTRRSTMNQSERVAGRKENPFDVEPSIAQKNIDIRNWLAALNFPTFPSTSTDLISEGNFTTQFSVDSQNPSKVNQKRRKVLPNLKFADEVTKKKVEGKEKHKRSSKWDTCEEEGLTELIRRKSGGFVTKEQYLNSEHSVHRPNVTVNFCVYSKSAEESIVVETSDRNSVCEPRKYKSVEVATQPEVSISATIINSGPIVGDQLVEKIKMKEKPKEVGKEVQIETGLGQFLKRDLSCLRSDVNIWKYLFILTLFIIVTHYCFLSNRMGHN